MGQNFKKGDRVRVRAWDDLAAEFGVDECGEIDTGYLYFVEGMKPLCGVSATIKGFDGRDVILDDWSCSSCTVDMDWSLSAEMLEMADD